MDILIKGNLCAKKLIGGGKLYTLVNEKDFGCDEKTVVIEGDVCVDAFVYGGNVVGVTGCVSCTEGGDDEHIG